MNKKKQKIKRLKFPHLPNWLLEITLIFCLSILGSCTHPKLAHNSNYSNIHQEQEKEMMAARDVLKKSDVIESSADIITTIN